MECAMRISVLRGLAQFAAKMASTSLQKSIGSSQKSSCQ
jgi:hypothetical protein